MPLFNRPPNGPPPSWPENWGLNELVEYKGAITLNTGIQPKGSQFLATFPNTGTFSYICVIHPGMAGTIIVAQPDRVAYTTADEAAATAQDEGSAVLALVDDLNADGLAGALSTAQSDGTTLWNVPVGALTQSPTGPLELLQYFPPALTISSGDTVRWSASTPHSVTFVTETGVPRGNPTTIPEEKPSDEYDGTSFYHSGVLALSPVSPTEFTLTFSEPGSYPYLCVLHWDIGHIGTIIVQ